MSKVRVNVEEFLKGLEGDVMVAEVYHLEGLAQERDYATKGQPLVRRDFTVAIWMHDGVSCTDVFITDGGWIEVYSEATEDDDDGELFMAVYNKPHASLRINGGIPDSLREAFLSTATQRQDFNEWW